MVLFFLCFSVTYDSHWLGAYGLFPFRSPVLGVETHPWLSPFLYYVFVCEVGCFDIVLLILFIFLFCLNALLQHLLDLCHGIMYRRRPNY